jgi:RND family efflux transporter MFP subunit
MNKLIFRPIVGFLGVAIVGAGCRTTEVPAPLPTAVKVSVVEHAGTAAGTHYSAQIHPATRIDVAFKVGGYVETVAQASDVDGKARLLQEGDAVRANMPLAGLRRTDYLQKVAEAQAALAQAKAGLDQAQLDLDRASKLSGANAIAGAELDATRTRRDSAAAVLAGAKARADQAATALADTTLRSPLSGVVMRRTIEVGMLAAPGTIGFSVADVSSVKAAFGVPDTVLPRIRLGAVESITTDAFPGVAFEGRITLIAPSADPKSRVFEVDVTIPNADGRLKPGTVAALSLEATPGGDEAAPLIPLSAIVRGKDRGQEFAVYVVDDRGGKPIARLAAVELGEFLGNVIPVVRGLSGGERVVVQGAGLLSDGEAVEIIQ